MKIRMKVGVSGTRNGQDWPPIGGTLLVSDEEGRQLCSGGLAEPVYEPEAEIETAVVADVAEKRGPGRPRKAQPVPPPS